jgi:hypothetical protein
MAVSRVESRMECEVRERERTSWVWPPEMRRV